MSGVDDVKRMRTQIEKLALNLGIIVDSFQIGLQDDGEYLILDIRLLLRELLKDSDQETIDAAFEELIGSGGLDNINPAISKQDFLQFLEEDD